MTTRQSKRIRKLGLRVGLAILGILAVWFFWAVHRDWVIQASDPHGCVLNVSGESTDDLSYIQLQIQDQSPNEPYFNGNIFMYRGHADREISHAAVFVSGHEDNGYYPEFRVVDIEGSSMRKVEPILLYREAGSHRNFPLDSGKLLVDVKIIPRIEFPKVMIRNWNPGFYVPCATASAKVDDRGDYRITFQMLRNPLITMIASVMLIAAFLFVVVTPFTLRRDAIPTWVASYFFSIWSIRGFLSAEIKVFPTLLDYLLLCFSGLLLFLIGVRTIWELRNDPAHHHEHPLAR